MYGLYSEETSGHQVNPCNEMFTQEQKTLWRNTTSTPLDTLTGALFKNPYSMYSGMCFLGVQVLTTKSWAVLVSV